MAEHSIILRKTEEARLDQLYQTKCDEVFKRMSFAYKNLGWINEHHPIFPTGNRKKYDIK